MTVYLVIFDQAAYTIGGKLFADIAAYIDDRYVDAHTDSQKIQCRRMAMASKLMERNRVGPYSLYRGPSGLNETLSKLDESFSRMLLRKIDERNIWHEMTEHKAVYNMVNVDRGHDQC